MDGDRCTQAGCTGVIEDGYCNVCGHAGGVRAASHTQGTGARSSVSATSGRTASKSSSTGSSPGSRSSKGSKKGTRTSSKSSRKQLGLGLVSVPELPSTEPERAILLDPKVPENKRYCAKCDNQLSREKGFCGKCGQRFSFVPSLNPGDLVAGQYLVKGALAYGGLGWIYLGFDNTLSRYVVLKGLLNTEDEASAAVAVAERQFLAAVKHPNIVGIYNFVKRGNEGFIVMEYVGGKTLKEIRKTRGPLPVSEAIAYVHRILGAFAYLHQLGLVYCDFKPDNVMLEQNDVKLIDMGGVRKIDDTQGDVYGTVGYSAPEAGDGPTAASDLFTVGRTLAVLLTDIRSFSKEHRYTLPDPSEEPLFSNQESLYRFLLKATAEKPDDRFDSADQMGDQLVGVLREVVALETKVPRPGASTLFGGDILALDSGAGLEPVRVDFRHIPVPALDTLDVGFAAVANAVAIPDASRRLASLQQVTVQVPASAEALLRYANALIETGQPKAQFADAEQALAAVEAKDAWDWRVQWYRGRSLLAQGKAEEAVAQFDQVYFDLPGELAPKLGLAIAEEMAGNLKIAVQMYDLVSLTDPGYTSASFGLARCLSALGDRKGAVLALARVPQNSSLYTRAQVSVARVLIAPGTTPPGADELAGASVALNALGLDGMERHKLSQQVLQTALNLLTAKKLPAAKSVLVLGCPLQENFLREGLEKSFRAMAHLSNGEEKIRLVDEANRVRPRTLF